MAFFVFQVHIHGRLVLNQPHCMGSSSVTLGYHLLCPIHSFPSSRCASGVDGSMIRGNKQQSRSILSHTWVIPLEGETRQWNRAASLYPAEAE